MSRSVRDPDYRTSTVAKEPQCVSAWDLLGAAPDITGGLTVDEYMDEQRGRGQE